MPLRLIHDPFYICMYGTMDYITKLFHRFRGSKTKTFESTSNISVNFSFNKLIPQYRQQNEIRNDYRRIKEKNTYSDEK